MAFEGLTQGLQAAGSMFDMYNAPQLNQLNLLQERARLQQMQGLDPVSQQNIKASQARIDLSQSQEERLQKSQEKKSQIDKLKMISGLSFAASEIEGEENKRAFIDSVAPMLQFDPNEIDSKSINMWANAHKIFNSGDFQKGRTVLVERDGEIGFATSSYNPKTQKTETSFSPLGGELVSDLGETRSGQIKSRAIEAREKSEQSGLGKTEAENVSNLVSNGLEAADSIALLKRSRQLLGEIQTGGFDAASLRVKQAFGVEGADEAELSFNLAKNVLQQLKPTFGAAFTVSEKESLERIESSIGKSTQGNIRLIDQALKIADRAARRGMKAAEKGGLDFELEEIRNALNFSLDPVENTSNINPADRLQELERELGL